MSAKLRSDMDQTTPHAYGTSLISSIQFKYPQVINHASQAIPHVAVFLELSYSAGEVGGMR